MATARFYNYIGAVKGMNFLKETDSKDILNAIVQKKHVYIRQKTDESLVDFINTGSIVIKFIEKEMIRNEVLNVKIMEELRNCLGETFKSVLYITNFNEPVWDAFLKFCQRANVMNLIYPMENKAPEGLSAWILKRHADIKIDSNEVRRFISMELGKNLKDEGVLKARFNYELQLATAGELKQLEAVIDHSINHRFLLDSLHHIYKKINRFPLLEKKIAAHIQKTHPNEMITVDTICKKEFIDLQLGIIPAEQAETVLNNCHSKYIEALRKYSNSEMHIFYIDFLKDLQTKNYIKSFNDSYYDALHMDMLENFTVVGPEHLDLTINVLKFLCEKGECSAANEKLANSFELCRDDESKLALLERALRENSGVVLQCEKFSFAVTILFRVVYIKSEFEKGGIAAARNCVHRKGLLNNIINLFFDTILAMELNEDPHCVESIRKFYNWLLANGTTKPEHYIKFINFELCQRNYVNVCGIYSFALNFLDNAQRLELKTEITMDEINEQNQRWQDGMEVEIVND